MTYDEVYDQVRNCLISGKFDDDTSKPAALYIGMASYLIDQFSDEQMRLLDIAKNYWAGTASDGERILAMAEIKKLKKGGELSVREESIWDLLFSCFINNQPFDPYIGEEPIAEAEELGIPADDLWKIFEQAVLSD